MSYRFVMRCTDMIIYHIDMVILDIDMGDEAHDMGDDSIDTVISHIHMGYLVTLRSGQCVAVHHEAAAAARARPRGPAVA